MKNNAGTTTYLSPGFLVTLGKHHNAFQFTQLPINLRRVTAARLAALDALNHGYSGDLHELAQDVAARYNGQVPALETFLLKLCQKGFTSTEVPAPRYARDVPVREGSIPDVPVCVPAPVGLLSEAGRYLWFDHGGELLVALSLPELLALKEFSHAIEVDAAWASYTQHAYGDSLDREQFDAFLRRLAGAGVLAPPAEIDPRLEPRLAAPVNVREIQALVDRRVAVHDEKVINSGKKLTQVIPCNIQAGTTPASLGLLMAYAMEYKGGRLNERYDFVPMFLTDEERVIARGAEPAVFLFSNYLWTSEENLKLSAAAKAANPNSVTVHGGPSTPSYENDCERFFIDHPHVDICVRGEGELTFSEILDALDFSSGKPDLEALRDVDGLTYRGADGFIRTGNRARIADINSIPSPYLKGLFDEFGSVHAGAVIETNRGCPYGCTFCDWGSATQSKVRKFDLDRVFAELEWSARNRIEDASVADANFGMLARDVEITEKIAELKREYGYPKSVGVNYAKNQVRYLRDIIRIMAEVGILTEGKVSLQSMDEETLQVIDRANIKLEKYNELATEFRRANLPLAVEIMLGLPGATTKAFHNDLQQCTNRDVRVMLNNTQVLPNSPMNDPEYRKEHGIKALPGEMLRETASYTEEEWLEMNHLKMAYYLFDNYGLLRYVARFVRSETGIGEVAFMDIVQKTVRANPGDWPILHGVLENMEHHMAPPGSWSFYIEEVRRFLLDEMQMQDTSALRTTLEVQHAHLPAGGRQFPIFLEMEHDFGQWWNSVLLAREEGHREDWERHAPKLSEFGPGTLTIDDPDQICDREVGKPISVLLYSLRTWELDSPVARPRSGPSFANWG